ncbi:hypothetical protein AAFF_G00399060 [Aldrovandia affinis]|uniref:ribonuclease H n=1 Tax=Aldrovandia affinis TaxID=143900 RepID=A0AAD7WKG8_9TELE|nr:hypothetical protein AAFF_G00399060 [Aldrovandia affinis]
MAVITLFELREFLHMPFGLKNLVQAPQCLMDSVLRDLTFLYVYLDDILVASDCKEQHLSHLWILFDCLSQHSLIMNLAKCQFGLLSINFLGHHITKDGAVTLPSKVAAMWDFPRPCMTKAVVLGDGELITVLSPTRLISCGPCSCRWCLLPTHLLQSTASPNQASDPEHTPPWLDTPQHNPVPPTG